jgi:hypothetical protein
MPNNAMQKQGNVQAFNVSPKGNYEGLLLQTEDELIQINFPQEFAAAMTDLAANGADVQLEVEAQELGGHACHPVYRLLSVTNAKEFAGKATRLNYALHGEVNGAILESGDFLHVKPHGATALKLRVGMNVKGSGSTKPMHGGHRVIEADEVNGIRIEKKPKPKKKTR